MKDVFPLNENSYYNTRNERKFHSRHIRTVHFGSETYHILHLKFWSQFQRLKNQNLSPTLKMRLKNGNQQIVLAAYAKHIYFRLALCDYFIIQSEAFFRLSFINIYYTIFVLQHMVWLRGSFSPIMTQLCPNCVGIESRSRHLFS